ncbi:hypothetical protein [Methylorubrum extorquens]|jgi:hypothetical protein|uniref:DUF4157 domain-containing protein n=1 Tax=Methylorubrum extorquens TaxID=408 RepID=A0AAX3WNH7_METEX|nr:hypothetical protein [Methylorubrum extorquens]WHQ72976.1 hypothetical protein KEC54_28380 [Methylorubrum extorquens]
MATTPIWHVVSALAVAGALTAHGEPAHAAPRHAPAGTIRFDDGGESYRGYRIAMAQDVPNAEIGQLRQAAEHQVDLVEATGLSEVTKAFFRRFPVVVRSGSGEGSHYSGGDSVNIAINDPKDDRPILLHEYMHVYHFRKLPAGRDNPDILTFYGRAREGGFYPAGAYVLKNQGEFFAMTASVYLHGRLAREPFTRDELHQKQPVYYRYLTRLFGPAGS